MSNFEYNLLDKHVEYSDQHISAVHHGLSNIDCEFMKVCTIIIIIDVFTDQATMAGCFVNFVLTDPGSILPRVLFIFN